MVAFGGITTEYTQLQRTDKKKKLKNSLLPQEV